MRKRILIYCIVLAFSITSFLGIMTVTAENEPQVFAGTPTVDGVLDDIYKADGNASLPVGAAFYAHNGAATTDSDASAVSYFLHDASNLYICTVVKDSTPLDFVERSGDGSWINDAVEYWTSADLYAPASGQGKISVAANGNIFNGADSGVVAAAKATDVGYIVEVAIPLAEGATTAGIAVQLDDLISEAGDNSQVIAHGGQTDAIQTLVLSSTVASSGGSTNPPSGAPLIIGIALTSFLSAGYIVSRKR